MITGITYTEGDLVLKLKQRNESAFSYLYDNYSGALYAVILNIVPDKELASDILQEVFIKIWKQIDTYDNTKGRLFTWMLNISRNSAIDALRSKSYQQSQKNRELDNSSATNNSFQLNTDKIGLMAIVDKLKPDYKVLIELSYFQGYTQEEISKILQLPLGTVKTRLRAALIQLKLVIKS